MKRFITLLIGTSLALAVAAQAKQAEQKNKKSKPVQQQQVAPKQHKAPKPQVQAVPRQHKNPTLQNNARNHNNKVLADDKPRKGGSINDGRYRLTTLNTLPAAPKTPKKLERTVPAVQSDKFKINKTVKTFQPRHQNFHARVNSSVASVQFNQNFRIRNAENWQGNHYNVFRTYRPQWHDRGWWHSNHRHIILIGGGWYYWNSGYWYPAWGYDDSAAYYPYDGPIYVGNDPKPFDQVVADVQASLQEQGYYRGEVDGLVGPLTQEALAAYQSAQGLAPTAAIDQPTLESLGMG